jgi:hypothetical protein
VVSTEGGQQQKIDDNAVWATWSLDGNYLYYRFGERGVIADVRTGKKSPVPSSEHSFVRWLNQDALIALKTDNFQTFDLRTQKWTDFAPGILSNDVMDWALSPDSKYLYYTIRGVEPKAFRLRIADQRVETITSLKDQRVVGLGINVAPDGSPVFTRDASFEEIYALHIRWP